MIRKFKKFIRLVHNEIIKSIFNKGTIVILVLMLISIVGLGLLNYGSANNNTNWRVGEQKEVTNLQSNIKENSLDIRKAKVATDKTIAELTAKMYRQRLDMLKYSLKNNIPLELETPLRFVYSAGATFDILILFLIILSINSIIKEYSYGTIKQLLIRPFDRFEILLSKQVCIITIAFVFIIIHVLISIITGYILFKNNGSGSIELVYSNNSIIKLNVITYIIQYYLASFEQIIIISSFAILISTFAKKVVVPMICTLILWLGSGVITQFIHKYWFAKFTIFPHLDLSQYIHGNNLLLDGNKITYSIIILFVYFLLINFLLYWKFTKQDIY